MIPDHPPLGRPPARAGRPWVALLVSLLLHAALTTFAVVRLHRSEPQAAQPAAPAARPEAVSMVYVPPARTPPAQRKEPPAQPQPRPQPQPARPVPPPNPPMERQPEHDQPAPMAPNPATSSDPSPRGDPQGSREPASATPTTGAPTEVATMESEARRIFGRHPVNQGTAGPLAVPGLPIYLPESSAECTPKPPTPGVIALDTVAGRVYQPDTGQPLPGAFLQIMGTPYVAIADQQGTYRLIFDRSLVDQCRTQWVRVTARGHRAQTLLLTRGPGTTDIPLARR